MTCHSNIELRPNQREAVAKLRNGSLLWGGVGSGKTYTSLFFYLENCSDYPLYVITTAKKRDTNDWQNEASSIGIKDIIVDSWNNIKKYVDVTNAFFIFDEQRVVGYGAWAKSFIKISKSNGWILLSATPGDTWEDYIPVMIANGFYKNKTDFVRQHIEYNPYVSYPQVKAYHNTDKLRRFRDRILVPMESNKHTTRVRNYVKCHYDKKDYERVRKDRWNPFEDKPIINASEFTATLRKIVNTDATRIQQATYIMTVYPKVIVFYNFNYELDILRTICEEQGITYAEWNGHQHEDIPNTDQWVYLVQYTAGAEGWNCIETNVMLFYSMNYSYRMHEQAEGRIDRMNTPFTELEYFYLHTTSTIDKAILKAVMNKRRFTESAWVRKEGFDA